MTIWMNQGQMNISVAGERHAVTEAAIRGLRLRRSPDGRCLVALDIESVGVVVGDSDPHDAAVLTRFAHTIVPAEGIETVLGSAPEYGEFGRDLAVLPELDGSLPVGRSGRPKSPMRTSTLAAIPNCRIVDDFGVVTGSTVRARHLGAKLVAGVTQNFGGELAGYTKLIVEARQEAVERMCEEARLRGANAVVGVGFASTELFEIAAELLAFGTAVLVETTPQ